MFSSVEDILTENEEIEETVHPSKKDTKYLRGYTISTVAFLGIVGLSLGLWQMVAVEGLLALALLLMPLGFAAKTELTRKCTMYHFTNEKVIVERGILNKDFYSVKYDKITHVETQEDIQERIFGVSDLYIHTAGEDESEIVLNGLEDSAKLRSLIAERS